MSFILDALKKAESERNRRVAPVLMDARIAPPRRGLPAWGWALGAVLLANLAVLAWLLLRAPAASPAGSFTAPAAAAPASATPANAVNPAATMTPPAPGMQPAPATAMVPAAMSPPPAANADADDLPSAQELLAAGVPLPQLQLSLHIYDLAPSNRAVLLNGVRLTEGEFTPDGVKVDRITPTGVVLEAGGRRFLLDAGG